MQRLLLFGYPCVEVDGTTLHGPPVQRHRLALLALLAMAPQRRLSRDKLIAWLWPNADQASGRRLLNTCLHTIRTALGDAALVSHGDEVQLDSAVLVDVTEFHDELSRARRENAVARYRAPFLEGFFLNDAAEFEQWAERERARLAATYRDELESLAAEAESHADTPNAIRWWRALNHSDPFNTRAVMRLMLALERAGDRGNALQLADEHQTLLAREFETQPDAGFLELVRRMREEPRASSTAAPPAPIAERPPAHDAAQPLDSPKRRQVKAAIVVSSLAAAIVVLGTLLWDRAPARRETKTTTPNVNLIAVLPFDVRGLSDTAGLGEGLSELLSTGLDVSGEFRAADQGAVLATLARIRDTTAAAVRRAVARSLGAGRILTGNVVHANGRLRVSAVVWHVLPGGRDSAASVMSADGVPDELFHLVDQLIPKILPAGRADPADPLERIASRTTESLEALKLFLAGSRALRRGEYARASALLEQATEIDTTFSLAYYRLATACEWNWQYDRARLAAARAIAHAARLAPTERLMAEALGFYLAGSAQQAEKMLERVVALRPEDTESWFRLAEIRFHFYASRDRPMEDSRQTWTNVLATDSNHIGALVHTVRFAALEDDTVAIDRTVARIRVLSPKLDRLWEVRALQAFTGGRAAAEREYITEALAAGDSAVAQAIFGVADFTDNVDGVVRLATALAASTNPEMRKVGLLKLAKSEMVAGRPKAADAWLRQLAPLDADLALVHRAYFATLPTVTTQRARLDSLASELRGWKPTIRTRLPTGAIQAFATLPPLVPQLHRYVQGRVAARLGRWSEVEQAEAQLRSMNGPAHARALAADMVLSLGALRALGKGDSAQALALLRRSRLEAPSELLNSSWFYSQTAEQFERAVLAQWSGRQDVALDTYAAVRHSRILAAPAAFAIAEIHRQSGNRAAAIREYRRVLRLRPSEEPDQQPLSQMARDRLDLLGVR